MTDKFDKEFMCGVIWGDHDDTVVVLDEIYDTSRWSEHHRLVFSIDNKYYETSYSKGLTEYQDEQPWQHDEPVVFEVESYAKTVIDYKVVDGK